MMNHFAFARIYDDGLDENGIAKFTVQIKLNNYIHMREMTMAAFYDG